MFLADYIAQDLVLFANPEAGQTWTRPGTAAPITSVSEGEMTRFSVRRQEPLVVELAEFARAVRDGGPPPVEPRDAMIALLLARKMVESAQRGEAIAGAALEEAIA
jgi:predicted dehydrogenase